MFTAMGSFFNRISDPGMGGAYLTLLNTIANMGKILLWTNSITPSISSIERGLKACLRPQTRLLCGTHIGKWVQPATVWQASFDSAIGLVQG